MAGIDKHVKAHTLRISLATHMIENDASQYVVKEQLRHSKLTTTYQYVLLSFKILRERYDEHVKEAIGKPDEEKKEMIIEKLNQLVMDSQISEELYLTLRNDIEKLQASRA